MSEKNLRDYASPQNGDVQPAQAAAGQDGFHDFVREIAQQVQPAEPVPARPSEPVAANDWAAAAESGRRIDGATGETDESVAGLIEMRLQRFLADLALLTEDFHRAAQRSRDKFS